MISKRSTLVALSITATLAALIVGCGGGGGTPAGSGSQTGSASASTKSYVRAVALSSYQTLGGGMAFPNQVLRLTAPKGSGIGSSPALPALRAFLDRDPLVYVSELNLYEQITEATNGDTIKFFSDSAGKVSAGSASITSTSGSLNFTTYPAKVSATLNLTAGNLPMSGSCSIVYNGPTGLNSIQASFTMPKSGDKVAVDMTLSGTHQVGGSATIVNGATTINATNIAGQLDGALICSVSVQPGNYTGTGSLNFGTEQVSLNLKSATGTATAKLGSDGNMTISYSDGTTETVTNPITATFGSGGTSGTTSGSTGTASTGATATATTAGGTSSTATTATGTTAGSTGASSASFATPIVSSWYTSDIYGTSEIYASNSAGAVVGQSNGSPAYASSPAAIAQVLPGGYKGIAYSINASGVIVGSVTTAAGEAGVVWTSPTANPIILPTPSGTTYSEATGINTKGEILGQISSAAGFKIVIWPSYKSTPTVTVDYDTSLINTDYPEQINDSDELYDFKQGDPTYVWVTPTKPQIALQPLVVTDGGYVITSYFGFSNYGFGGSTYNGASGTTVGTYWAAPGFAAKAVPVTSDVSASGITGIDNSGEMTGTFATTGISGRIGFWQPGKTQLDLTTQLTKAFPKVVGGTGKMVLEDGSLVVAGYDTSGSILNFYYMKRQK